MIDNNDLMEEQKNEMNKTMCYHWSNGAMVTIWSKNWNMEKLQPNKDRQLPIVKHTPV